MWANSCSMSPSSGLCPLPVPVFGRIGTVIMIISLAQYVSMFWEKTHSSQPIRFYDPEDNGLMCIFFHCTLKVET